jgi:hypothetical protein
MIEETLLDRITTKWWLPRSVEDDKLQKILDAVYLSPSKQGKFNHNVYVLGSSELSMELKHYLFWEDTYCINGIRGAPGPGWKRFNGQVNAPIVLVWFAKNYATGAAGPLAPESDLQRVRDDCIVSATVAMCAAEELGLQTGFCGCISHYHFAAKVSGQPINKLENTSVIALGIGYGYTEPKILRRVFEGSVFAIPHPNDRVKSIPNAYELILKNKNFLIEELSSWIQTQATLKKPPFNRFVYDNIKQEKCKRDIELVLGSYLHDIQFNTLDATRSIVSYYWDQNVLQVKNVNMEIAVYQFLQTFIKNNILQNLPYTPTQLNASQYINTSIVAEPESLTKINELTDVMINGFQGSGNLKNMIGEDFTNVTPTRRDGINRRLRPPESSLVKYL